MSNKNKWLKFTFFTILLIGAGYFFGTICRQIGQAYDLILSPSGELLYLLLWLLVALGGLMVAAGLVAALLRPLWIGIIAFVLSGLAILLGWRQVDNGQWHSDSGVPSCCIFLHLCGCEGTK